MHLAAGSQPGALSNAAVHKLLHAGAGGIPERLSHPHSLRAYYATTLAAERVAVHVIAARSATQTSKRPAATCPSSPTTPPPVGDCPRNCVGTSERDRHAYKDEKQDHS